jgi:uncharacterized protein YndB with AHSA1/START domain
MIADHPSKLKMNLPSDREILWSYEFDAPREIVWKAMHDPKLIPQWWGPRKYETIVEQFDFRPGGKWVIVNKGEHGTFRFFGEFKEIVPPEKIVQTISFTEGTNTDTTGDMGVSAYTLVERGGRTTVTERSLFPSKEERDSAIKSGMEEGARETWERLEELVATLKPA